MRFLDARIPVRFGTADQVETGDILLIENGADASGQPGQLFGLDAAGHGIACACCVPHNAAALALNELFQARARNQVAFFRRVLAVTCSPEGDVAVSMAVQRDPIVSGRFRME